MNIKETKEAIEGLLDWTEAKRVAGEAGYGIDTKSYESVLGLPSVSNLAVADIKALAESHTRLLEAAKGLVKEINREPIANFATDDAVTDLETAIAEAEK